MDNKQIYELISKYYSNLIFEIENNSLLKKAITNPNATSNLLFITGESIYQSLLIKMGIDKFDNIKHKNERIKFIETVNQISFVTHNNFIDELNKKSIFVRNALGKKTSIKRERRFYYADEYNDYSLFQNEINALKSVFDTTDSSIVKEIISKAISEVYEGAFATSSIYSKIENGYFFKENKELYDNFNKDRNYWESSLKNYAIYSNYHNNDSIKVFPEELREKIIEILFKGKIIYFSKNYEKEDLIISFLNEIKDLQLLIKNTNPNFSQRFEKLMKDNFCTSLYKYSNKESTPLQSKYVSLLLPIMGKERESGLSLLKSEFKRNTDIEESLSSRELYDVNLLINFKKTNKKIANLLSVHFNIQHEEGLIIAIKKLNEKTYSFGISLNPKHREGLSDEDIIDLKEIFKDILVNKINEILVNDKVDNIQVLRELNFIFSNELRAKKVKVKLSSQDKKETKKLKI